MYTQRQIEVLNAIAHKYRPLIHQTIHGIINQPPYKNTGAAAASLTVDVIEGNAQHSPQINISFADHLLLLDKRKLQWTKLPNMKELMAWAQTREPDEKKAKRLAWSVAKDKQKNDTWKRKPWRKKSLSNVLKEMNTMILEEYAKATDGDLQDAITFGSPS